MNSKKMKKTLSVKSLFKSPSTSIKTIKSAQKPFQHLNAANSMSSAQELLKIRIENINKNLNSEVRQRQSQFKEMYKMIMDLHKLNRCNCKHDEFLFQKNKPDTVNIHLPLADLLRDQKSKKKIQTQDINNLSQNEILSINNLSKNFDSKNQNRGTVLLRKQKRKLKFEIKSHKNIPAFIYQDNSNVGCQIQNEEENQRTIDNSNIETTKSQFFNSSFCTNINSNADKKLIVSDSNFERNFLEEIKLKLGYFENKLQSLAASQNLLEGKVDAFNFKQESVNQFQKLDSQVGKLQNLQTKIISISKDLDQKLNKTFEFNLNQIEKIKSEFRQGQNFFQAIEIKQMQFVQNLKQNEKFIENLFDEVKNIRQKEQKFQRLAEYNKKEQSVKPFQNLKPKNCANESLIQSSFYNDEIFQLEQRLQNTEDIISELIKISLILTKKINSFANKGFNKLKSRKTESKIIAKKLSLSQRYWSLKDDLGKIDEQSIECSRQIINQTILEDDNEMEVDSLQENAQNFGEEAQIILNQA